MSDNAHPALAGPAPRRATERTAAPDRAPRGETMLRRLAGRLVMSAQGQTLAIEIADRYGAHALEIVDAVLADADLGAADRTRLTIARREIARLMPLLDAGRS